MTLDFEFDAVATISVWRSQSGVDRIVQGPGFRPLPQCDGCFCGHVTAGRSRVFRKNPYTFLNQAGFAGMVIVLQEAIGILRRC